jgi:hypothetical protein
MNLANHFNLTNAEMGLIFVGGTVVFFFFITWIYLRTILRCSYMSMVFLKQPTSVSSSGPSVEERQPPLGAGPLNEWVQASESICQDLSRNLEEKKEITKRLIAQLDEKIQSLQAMLKKVDEGDAFPPQEKIVEMAEAGCDISDIARQLRLSQGEIQLTLDLQKYRQSSS